jgi:hypothetical protein
MGTRALVHFARDADIWSTVYVHSDGYPTGVGADIKRLFLGAVMRNGIRDDVRQVNGAGCAAAQYVSAMKNGPGGVYIYKTGSSGFGEDYTYTVDGSYDEPLRLKVEGRAGTLFDGPLDQFDPEAVEKSERDSDD